MNTKHNRTLVSIIQVSASNIIRLLAGIFVGFLLPKVIGVTNYGIYKTFTLYCSYVSIFSFGFADGIYLKYGGINYEEINKNDFRTYSRVYIAIQAIVTFIGIIISSCWFDITAKVVFIFTALYLFSANVTGYYQYISQITRRFKELSYRNIIYSVITILGICFLFFLYKINDSYISYFWYMLFYITTCYALTIWYILTYKDLLFGKASPLKVCTSNIFNCIKIGIPLAISNLCLSMLLSIDRQFVNLLYDIDTYSVYAFAYNMLSLITTAMAAISTVIYPSMKRENGKKVVRFYDTFVAIILSLTFACIAVYYPLSWFVPWFLPKYSNSLIIFKIILPGLSIQSVITIVIHNYYKIDGKSTSFFVKSLIVLLLSIIANFVAYYCFKTTISISIASIIIMMFWYFILDFYYLKHYKTNSLKNYLYIILMGIVFYIFPSKEWWYSLIIYCFFYFTITYLFYGKLFNFPIKEQIDYRVK